MANSFRKAYSPFGGGDKIWVSSSNASVLAETEFFGSTILDTTGFIKQWTGTAWQLKPMKYWNGTAWVQKPVRYWNGAYWLLTEYGLGANFHPSPLDIFAWSGSGSNTSTITRDTGTGLSPSGGVPLKMAITGDDPHLQSYDGAAWNIAPAAAGQTWVVKAWAKASVATTGEIFIFGVDSGGNFIANFTTAFNAGGVSIGTNWTEVSYGFKFTDPNVAFIQTRLDGTAVGGTGINIWWDDLQVYRVV